MNFITHYKHSHSTGFEAQAQVQLKENNIKYVDLLMGSFAKESQEHQM
jgi:hypothetical protein